MSESLTSNMAYALDRLSQGDVIIYMAPDPGGAGKEAVWFDRRPQLRVHMRTFRTARRRNWIARGIAPAESIYRDSPTYWQAWLITPAGRAALDGRDD
jgi:hypothetical protein